MQHKNPSIAIKDDDKKMVITLRYHPYQDLKNALDNDGLENGNVLLTK